MEKLNFNSKGEILIAERKESKISP